MARNEQNENGFEITTEIHKLNDVVEGSEEEMSSAFRCVLMIDKNGKATRHIIRSDPSEKDAKDTETNTEYSDYSLLSFFEIDGDDFKNFYLEVITYINKVLKVLNITEDVAIVSTSDCHCDLFSFFLPLVLCNKIKLEVVDYKLNVYYRESDIIYINNGDYLFGADDKNVDKEKEVNKYRRVCTHFKPIIKPVVCKLAFCKSMYFIMGNHDKHIFSNAGCYWYVEVKFPNIEKPLLFIHSVMDISEKGLDSKKIQINNEFHGIVVKTELQHRMNCGYGYEIERSLKEYVAHKKELMKDEYLVYVIGHDLSQNCINWTDDELTDFENEREKILLEKHCHYTFKCRIDDKIQYGIPKKCIVVCTDYYNNFMLPVNTFLYRKNN